VHSGYEGPLSGVLVNISNKENVICIDDPIFELILIENDEDISAFPKDRTKTNDKYKREVLRLSTIFPESFIDIRNFEERLIRNVSTMRWRNMVSGFLLILASVSLVLYFFEYHANARVLNYITDFEKTESFHKSTVSVKEFRQLQEELRIIKENMKKQNQLKET